MSCSQCDARPFPALKIEGEKVPVLYSRTCAEGDHCDACKWDREAELRKNWPKLPPCFESAMDENAQWEELRRDSDDHAKAKAQTRAKAQNKPGSLSRPVCAEQARRVALDRR